MLDTMAAAVDAWLPGAQQMLALLAAHPEWWLYTALPLLASMAAVHMFFRHFVSVVWLALKATVAVVVYTHVRAMLSSQLGPDPLKLEPAVFGVPPGTLYLTASLGFRVATSRALAAAASACPSCFPAPPEPDPPPPFWDWGAPAAWVAAAYGRANPAGLAAAEGGAQQPPPPSSPPRSWLPSPGDWW